MGLGADGEGGQTSSSPAQVQDFQGWVDWSLDEGYSGQTADPTGAEETSPDGVAIDLDEVIALEVERSLDDLTGPTWVTGQELVTVLVQETFLDSGSFLRYFYFYFTENWQYSGE